MATGCSDNEVTAPAPGTIVIAEDPLDDVLKSTDGRTPTDPRECCSRLAEVLGLDEDQRSALTMGEARNMAGAMRDAFEAEMQIIMTAEQWDMLQDMRHEGLPHDDQRRGGHHGGGHHHQGPTDLWGSMFEDLGLDADQITAVLAALDVLHEGMQDLRPDCGGRRGR